MTELRTIIAIDQGTTSSRAILFDEAGTILAQQSAEFPQHFPADGWVEHDPEHIWRTTKDVTAAMVAAARARGSLPIAVGIANQRETAIIWDRSTGKPIHNAIVWQDRRTADICAVMKNAGKEAMVTERTGLLLDPYFTATKLSWILDNVDGASDRAAASELCFGTVDSFLIWRLTGGKMHVTDATNASHPASTTFIRMTGTMICWICSACRGWAFRGSGLRRRFGICDGALFDAELPSRRCRRPAGRRHRQGCFTPGALKSTYGTGCLSSSTPAMKRWLRRQASDHRRLPAWRQDNLRAGRLDLCIGAIVQWLRDGMKLIGSAGETEAIATTQTGNNDVYGQP